MEVQGWPWGIVVCQYTGKENPSYPKISPQIHAKYQNVEKQGIRYTYKGPNFGVNIPYTRFLIPPVYHILKNPGRPWVMQTTEQHCLNFIPCSTLERNSIDNCTCKNRHIKKLTLFLTKRNQMPAKRCTVFCLHE